MGRPDRAPYLVLVGVNEPTPERVGLSLRYAGFPHSTLLADAATFNFFLDFDPFTVKSQMTIFLINSVFPIINGGVYAPPCTTYQGGPRTCPRRLSPRGSAAPLTKRPSPRRTLAHHKLPAPARCNHLPSAVPPRPPCPLLPAHARTFSPKMMGKLTLSTTPPPPLGSAAACAA